MKSDPEARWPPCRGSPSPVFSGCALASAKTAPLAPLHGALQRSVGTLSPPTARRTNQLVFDRLRCDPRRNISCFCFVSPIPSQTSNKIPVSRERDLLPATRIVRQYLPDVQVGDDEGAPYRWHAKKPTSVAPQIARRSEWAKGLAAVLSAVEWFIRNPDSAIGSGDQTRCFSFARTKPIADAPRSTRTGLLLTNFFARLGSPCTVALRVSWLGGWRGVDWRRLPTRSLSS